ncbi:MAG TPA: ABC transporter permease [Terracidiphilus sp.]|jgi:putative ABC transport system permease protein|nr:ABC transporter permease [Terracidiphilus sp.]
MRTFVEGFLQAARYGFLHVRCSPGFTTIAAGILALGIGANTAIYSLVEAALFPTFSASDSSRLVGVYSSGPNRTGYSSVSYPDYTYFRDHNALFSGLMAYANIRMRWTQGDQTTFPWAGIVTSNYFSVLGVKPIIGRTFLPGQDVVGEGSAVAVVSYQFWKRQLASQRGVVGKTLVLNDHSFAIVGVLPRNFEGVDLAWGGIPDIWIPMSMQPIALPTSGKFNILESRQARAFLAMGRLKEGVSLAQARAEMKVLARQLEEAYPEADKERTAFVLPAREARMWPGWRESVVQVLLLLTVAVGFVLLVACANVANLLLTRAVAREREMALRLALGGTRERIIFQLLAEGIVLAIIGAVGGLVLAELLIKIGPPPQLSSQMHMNLDLGLDYRVFAVTLLLSLITAFLFAMLPAIRASRVNLVEALKKGQGHSSGKTNRGALRDSIIVIEVAFAFLSLIGGGLFVRSLLHLESKDTGFNSDKVLSVTLLLPPSRSPSQSSRFYAQLAASISSSSAVESVCLTGFRPLDTLGTNRHIVPEGSEVLATETGISAQSDDISPGYFSTLHIPLLRGRDFTRGDDADGPLVAIINHTFAETIWPHQNPIGKQFKLQGDNKSYQVIGVAADIKYHTVWEAPEPYIYLALAQQYDPEISLLVRTKASPMNFIPELQEQIGSLDKTIPLFDIEALDEQVKTSLSRPRVIATLLTLFGVIALLLAMAGIYAVVSYSVRQRTHEIGIRMALGARKGDVLRMVIAEGLKLALIGVFVGCACAVASTRLLSSLLYGVTPTDLLTFVVVSFLLIVVALLASYAASRRATKVDPMVALRYE